MIKLDYQTNNTRWGLSGMKFSDWNSFSLVLGFLSNIQHYKRHAASSSIWNDSISVHFERNKQQGAWGSEGRIHYYGILQNLSLSLHDLFAHKSSGNVSITCRINSNDYIYSLIYDFDFVSTQYSKRSTIDVFPPDNVITVKTTLQNALLDILHTDNIQGYLNQFDIGFSM